MPTSPSVKLKTIHTALLERIEDGTWKVGELIAPARDLAKEYDCSIGMMSKALAMLVHDGLAEQRPRLGTRVINTPRNTRETAGESLQLDAFAFIQPTDLHEGGLRMMTTFQKAAARAGRRTLALSTGADFQKEMEIMRRLDEFDVQGAAMSPLLLTGEDHIQFSELILSVKFPIVLIDHCPIGVECVSVHQDCFHAGYTVTRHLLEQGARRIGFLTNNSLRLSGRNRYDGYRWAMQEAGVDPVDALILLESSCHPNYEDPFAEPTELGHRYLKKTRSAKAEAVVCSNDELAVGLLRACRSSGLKVPDDIKIAGIDNIAISGQEDTSLTTYETPYEALGILSFELLNAIVSGQPVSRRDHSLRGKLIVRSST